MFPVLDPMYCVVNPSLLMTHSLRSLVPCISKAIRDLACSCRKGYFGQCIFRTLRYGWCFSSVDHANSSSECSFSNLASAFTKRSFKKLILDRNHTF